MLIWSGWGLAVVVIAAVGLGAGVMIASALGLPSHLVTSLSLAIAGLVGGVGSFVLARAIEGKPGRVFIDEETQQRIEVRDNAGSLFFIPTRYWAFIMPLVGIGLGVMMYLDPSDRLPEPGTAEAAALDAETDAAILEAARKRGLVNSGAPTAMPTTPPTAAPAEAPASQASGGGE